jgi:hypothetical protein
MFITYRYTYRYGNEGDPVDVTFKEFEDIKKAVKYLRRYQNGTRYISSKIEDDNFNILYEDIAGVGETINTTNF